MRHTLLLLLGTFVLWPFGAARRLCNVTSDTVMVHDVIAEQVQYGSASALKAGLAQPWPLVTVGNQRLRVIKYCYATKVYRDYLHCSKVNVALKIWAEKLGYPANAQTGHSLAWVEANDGNEDKKKRKRRYCYKNYEHGKGGTWNKNVDADTLAIFLDPTFDGAKATTGYDALSNEPGRHQMILGIDADSVEIAHELGHVFGMVHEQVRNDRDEHVVYECRNVEGYATALAKAMSQEGLTETEAHAKLCEDRLFAGKYEFVGSQFTKNPEGKIHDEPGGFDTNSIMMYSSDVFADPACDSDKTKCPLLKLVKINGEIVGTNRILENTQPSDGDIAWAKSWYPHETGGPS